MKNISAALFLTFLAFFSCKKAENPDAKTSEKSLSKERDFLLNYAVKSNQIN